MQTHGAALSVVVVLWALLTAYKAFPEDFVLRGDVDGSAEIGLGNAIVSAQISAQATTQSPPAYALVDINGDQEIGIAEALFALQILAGTRPHPDIVYGACLPIPENRVWVSIDPIQCGGNPWQQDRSGEDHMGELSVIKKYYEDRGIVICEMRRSWPYEATCLACSCPRGDRVYLYIDERGVEQMREWGFQALSVTPEQTLLRSFGLAEAIYAMQAAIGCSIPGIVINEVLANPDAGQPAWLELYNPTGDPADIDGWYLSDDVDNLTKYEIAAATLAPGPHSVFYQDKHFGAAFTLSENGGAVYLTSSPVWMSTGCRKKEDFGASERGVAFGRYEKSTGTFNFVAMGGNTPGEANAYPKVGPVVINEIMYHPASGDENEEYIELYNTTDSPVVLQAHDVDRNETVPWRFTDGVVYTFPMEATVPANGYLLVVKDPATFAAAHTVPEGMTVLGPYEGQLGNGGEKLEISMPGDVNELGQRQYIRIDRVRYDDSAPWPTGPDGEGSSLMRKHPDTYGNDVINWDDGMPTPGR